MEGVGCREGAWTLRMTTCIPVLHSNPGIRIHIYIYMLNSVRAKLKIKIRWNNRRAPEGLVEDFGRWISNAEVLPSTTLARKAKC